ncbi:MAG: hypothetical protein PF508_15465 [Spirochaeta sp.]|jgi:hypothetical protein|nr:hypothetical protein [Spirochaeta sp.]
MIIRIQVAAAILALETSDLSVGTEVDVPYGDDDDTMYRPIGTTIDARLAGLIVQVLPDVGFSEHNGIATLRGVVLPPSFTPTMMCVSWSG